MSIVSQFLNIFPIVVFLQLSVYVWMINKRAVINRILAATCILLAIENTLVYYIVEFAGEHLKPLLYSFDVSIWGIVYILIIYFLVLFVEHPKLSKKKWLILFALVNLPLVFNPAITIPIAKGYFKDWAQYWDNSQLSIFTLYYFANTFLVLGILIYVLTYARYTNTNYRIQKQALIVSRAFIFVILFFLPLIVFWLLGFNTSNYLSLYPEVLFFSVIVYAISKYRAQSLNTSDIYNQMIEHSSEFNMVVSVERIIVSVNKHVEHFIGYKKQNIEGNNLFDFFENTENLKAELVRLETEQNYSPMINMTMRLPNNVSLAMKTSVTPIRNKFREILGFHFIFFAPTEEVKKAEDLQSRYDLSNRETEVAILLVKGFSNQKIADQLFISLATVKTHTNNIYRKTGTANKVELKKLVI